MTDFRTWKTGLSTPNLEESDFAAYAQNGISAIEISRNSVNYVQLDWKAIKKYAAQSGVELWSCHLPFSSALNIASLQAQERANTVQVHTELIKKAADAGVKVCVIHPSAEPIEPQDRARAMEYSARSLVQLAGVAKQNGLILAVEDLPRTCLGRDETELAQLLQCDSSLRVCFDVNHLLRSTHEKFIAALHEKIVTLHISDYDFIDERHLLPGDGKIDWKKLLTLLMQADYDGPFLYEVSFPKCTSLPDAPEHSFTQVRQNHLHLMD